MLDWYRRLIALRREISGIRDRKHPIVRFAVATGWIVVDRDDVSLIANVSTCPTGVPCRQIEAPGDSAHRRRWLRDHLQRSGRCRDVCGCNLRRKPRPLTSPP